MARLRFDNLFQIFTTLSISKEYQNIIYATFSLVTNNSNKFYTKKHIFPINFVTNCLSTIFKLYKISFSLQKYSLQIAPPYRNKRVGRFWTFVCPKPADPKTNNKNKICFYLCYSENIIKKHYSSSASFILWKTF